MTLTTTQPAARVIRTPDQRLRVFVSSTLEELAPEREAAKEAVARLNLTPVMFELGARPHPPRELYRAYLEQSHVFVGIYWQRYGWIAPGEEVSGLEDEYLLSGSRPKLIYVKRPAPEREGRLEELIDRIRADDRASYEPFETPEELRELLENDLAVLLSERFEAAEPPTEARVDNLPRPYSSLVDRERERAAVSELLRREDTTLVTLTGPAGTGKSRLALQLGIDLRESFASGACWVSLAPVHDPDLLVAAIAEALQLRETTSSQPLEDLLHDRLRDAEMLLLLDNFEQIVDAAPTVSALLSRCPRLKALVTSRTPLRVRGERAVPIAPLALPEERAALEEVASSPAVALFVERARSVDPAFALTAENAPVIAEVCRQLDGLPLAIELTAARVKLFSPQALLARLTGHRGARLDVPSAAARDLPARQRTLRYALDWSHDLLTDEAKTFFRRMAVFAGGWALEAAEHVGNAANDLGIEVVEELQALQDMSLLTRHDAPGGEPRFGMLKTVQEYALERLIESGELEAVRRRHAEFFLALAEQADAALLGPDRETWVARLDQEHDNLLAVLERSLGADRRLGLRLAGALGTYWLIQSHFSEGRRWLRLLLEDRASLGRTREVARALAVAGSLAWRQGDAATGEPLLRESVELCRDSGDDALTGYALVHLGLTELAQGRPAEAHASFEGALERYRAAGDAWGITFSQVWLGTTTRTRGDPKRALALHAESLARAREVGDPWLLASALDGLADLRLHQGQAEAAVPLYEEATRLFREVGDRHALAWAVASLGFALLRLEDHERAQGLFEETLALGREYDNPTLALLYLTGMAGVAALRGRGSPSAESVAARLGAARLFGAVDHLHRELGATMWLAFRGTAEELLAAAKDGVDPAAWDAAFAAGRETSLERAIAQAAELTARA